MNDELIRQVVTMLQALQVENAQLRQTVDDLAAQLTARTSIHTGNVTGSTGVAIGENIRQVINQINLPPDQVAALLDARSALAGLDTQRYQLGAFIQDKTRDFAGRAHVFAAFDDFVQREPRGYFIVEADPGFGKSAFLAEYVRRHGSIAHFNVRAQGIVTAAQFLENVCGQLIADRGLAYAVLPPNATQDGAFLSRLLSEASGQLKSGERLIIAVDALDEVDLAAQPAGSNVLYLPAALPNGVYFLLTQRPADLPLLMQTPQQRLDLMQYPVENRADVELYLRRRAGRSPLSEWIAAQQLTIDAFVARLAERSESNFMYLRYVLPEIERGAYHSLDLTQLPAGLEGYYEDHWRRMGMTARPLPRVKIRIVYVLSEAQKPVSRRLIAQLSSDRQLTIDELSVQEVLDEWEQFLREQPDRDEARYSVYHASFRDFLHRKDVVQAAGVSLKDIHGLMVDSLAEGLDDLAAEL